MKKHRKLTYNKIPDNPTKYTFIEKKKSHLKGTYWPFTLVRKTTKQKLK